MGQRSFWLCRSKTGDTVDGSGIPNKHLAYIEPCKEWDLPTTNLNWLARFQNHQQYEVTCDVWGKLSGALFGLPWRVPHLPVSGIRTDPMKITGEQRKGGWRYIRFVFLKNLGLIPKRHRCFQKKQFQLQLLETPRKCLCSTMFIDSSCCIFEVLVCHSMTRVVKTSQWRHNTFLIFTNPSQSFPGDRTKTKGKKKRNSEDVKLCPAVVCVCVCVWSGNESPWIAKPVHDC